MTRDPIHPGETLREDLDALGMSAAELARRIDVPVNRITEILNGRRAVGNFEIRFPVLALGKSQDHVAAGSQRGRTGC